MFVGRLSQTIEHITTTSTTQHQHGRQVQHPPLLGADPQWHQGLDLAGGAWAEV